MTEETTSRSRATTPTRRQAFIGYAIGILLTLFIVLLAANLALTHFFVTCTVVHSSMNNTLFNGDRVFVDTSKKKPLRIGDIIVFHWNDDVVIKRCVGLPGDTVAIANGDITVNGHSLAFPQTIIEGKRTDAQYNLLTFQQYGENWKIGRASCRERV